MALELLEITTVVHTGCFLPLGLPLKVLSTEKLILARLGVSRTNYVNVDSPNLGFTYFNLLGGYQLKKTPCIYLAEELNTVIALIL